MNLDQRNLRILFLALAILVAEGEVDETTVRRILTEAGATEAEALEGWGTLLTRAIKLGHEAVARRASHN